MTNQEHTQSLMDELNAVILRHCEENDISYAEAIGILDILKNDYIDEVLDVGSRFR